MALDALPGQLQPLPRAAAQRSGLAAQSPTLVVRAHTAELHIPQVKKIQASKVMERKHDPDLVTVGVDLNVKHLAVLTVRQHGQII